MTVYRLRDKKEIFVSKESFWESVWSDTYMCASNAFVLYLAHTYFGNEWLPCLILWICALGLIMRFKEKQVTKEEFIKMLEELKQDE